MRHVLLLQAGLNGHRQPSYVDDVAFHCAAGQPLRYGGPFDDVQINPEGFPFADAAT